MAAHSYCRGHKIIRDEKAPNGWVYADCGEPCWGPDDRRPCKRCGKEPTREGHDACLGNLGDDIAAACCGHGVQKGWVTTKKSLGGK